MVIINLNYSKMENEKITIVSASDILSKRISITIEDVMKQFIENYNESKVEAVFVGIYISDEIKIKLFNLGFKYRTQQSPVGETCHIISLT